MRINGTDYSKSKGFFKRLGKRILDKIPSKELGQKADGVLKFASKKISSPEQRLILGVTALVSQPFFDLYNKDVDEKTAKISMAKTLGKIIAGTLVGVSVRKGSIMAISKYTKYVQNATTATKASSKSLFTPSKMDNFTETTLKNYQNAIGTYLGLTISLVTNFLIDAPLTKYFTNFFAEKIKRKDSEGVKK